MTEYFAGEYDVAVIGGGHAGAEASLASARLGASTVLFSMSLDALCNLPCNPSVGGTAKGHLVRELDALGGEMGKAADAVFLQSRMLNRGKGPAVHSLRVQVDRAKYHLHMKKVLENQPGLSLKQAEIADIRLDENGAVKELVTALGAVYRVKAAVICTGTYLNGKVFVGDSVLKSGPDGLHAAEKLTASIARLGLRMQRFKTGTPARAHRDSIDFSKLETQLGDEPVTPFSFATGGALKNTLACHIAYTNEKTHEIIRGNIERSAMYSGNITGIGARYCPSIEDKVIRFADKKRHQIFVEPMGLDTAEMYLQGASSSLPEDVQIKMYRTIKGFERIEIMRVAYAIEYDCIDSAQLKPTLESLKIPGLYGAGQFNGTSGYEEAAAQGFVAGVNAAHKALGKAPFTLMRSGSYIGTLIDDLVTKGCLDPYRMMTSRSEYRLLLRQDNADTRLTPIGRELGLIGNTRWEMFLIKQKQIEDEKRRILAINLPPSEEINRLLLEKGTTPVTTGVKMAELLKRPQMDYESLLPFDEDRPELSRDVTEQIEIQIKYEGYIEKQKSQVKAREKMEKQKLPDDINYGEIQGIRLEAREKLSKIRPESVGQAARISGVSPADISVLLIYLEQQKRMAK
ncbi:MAG: tRNA uridine-5-carboxymethylaminomethyl(34) synthesis enzyme MnmG [Oscillospiraceae bacterium]|nr:tRNA uridine-5-carboxymethylaminomethyl(34) synthesis enzyme MnmG [Oscillospiraceae bacterium]